MDSLYQAARGSQGGAPRPASSLVLIPEMKVDPGWYMQRHAARLQHLPDLKPATLQAHFQAEGDALGLDPNPAFLLSHWMTESDHARRQPPHAPAEDYIRSAGTLRHSAHWLFDEDRYQALNPKVADAAQKRNIISGYVHYLRSRTPDHASPHPLFNAAYYRQVAGLPAETSAFLHFLTVGQFEGLSPHPLFDTEHYTEMATIPEGIGRERTFTCALHHFIRLGLARDVPPIPDFDPDFYRALPGRGGGDREEDRALRLRPLPALRPAGRQAAQRLLQPRRLRLVQPRCRPRDAGSRARFLLRALHGLRRAARAARAPARPHHPGARGPREGDLRAARAHHGAACAA
jgi:hypothetical protein